MSLARSTANISNPCDGINGLAWPRTYAGAMRHPFFRGVSSQLAGASVLRSAPAIFGRAG